MDADGFSFSLKEHNDSGVYKGSLFLIRGFIDIFIVRFRKVLMGTRHKFISYKIYMVCCMKWNRMELKKKTKGLYSYY